MPERTLAEDIEYAFGYQFSYLLDEGGRNVTAEASRLALKVVQDRLKSSAVVDRAADFLLSEVKADESGLTDA